ncbi:MAG: hypothetical protein ACT4O1_06425 [Gemmatimonadota bacterium]
MLRNRVLCALLVIGVLVLRPRSAAAQHEHDGAANRLDWGAHAVGLVTHTTPAVQGRALTEGYITQPGVAVHAAIGSLAFSGMLNLEGLTLERGELNHGVWGEGYVDRRHPHTYLHEAMLTWSPRLFGTDVSVSAGRGFAPFGTDDPMVRHFVKYPSNHHLAQILERLLVIGAVRKGPVIIEGGVFNGDEPLSPKDVGSLDRFADSWSARATLVPMTWLELEASYADVTSPEQPLGGGLDHKAWNVSARVNRSLKQNQVYGLVEVGRAGEFSGELEIFHFHTVLIETAVRRGGWQIASRFEQSDRPEEEREPHQFPFRSVRPATDNNIFGITRWTTGSLQLSRSLSIGRFAIEPLLEVARLHAEPHEKPAILDPENLYGSSRLWSFSAGIRSSIGIWHTRMGRYGAAMPTAHTTH